VAIAVGSRLRIINESVKLAVESKNYTTRLSRCKLAMDHCSDIKRDYEDRGITAMNPTATFILSKLRNEYPTIVREAVQQIVTDAHKKAEVASSATTKANAFGKAALALSKLQAELGDDSAIKEAEEHMRKAMDVVKAASLIDEGQKAEFKGNTKKALDRYVESLYLVLHDKTDDGEQRELIAMLETNITRLGGDVPRMVSSVELKVSAPDEAD